MNELILAGFGLKPSHFAPLSAMKSFNPWVEVHPENYFYDEGAKQKLLKMRGDRNVSLHGVGASLGGPDDLCLEHMKQWRRLVDQVEPFLVSEHLSWSQSAGAYHHDLLPILRNQDFLNHICDRIDIFQNALGRSILIENPSGYMGLRHEIDETEFLMCLCQRTGCELLIDINNVFISAHNLGFDPEYWLEKIPAILVREIHLAGHVSDPIHSAFLDSPTLIDSHGAEISEDVWLLYQNFIDRIGPRPTLIERDQNLPPFDALMSEVIRAQSVLDNGHRLDCSEPLRDGLGR